MRIGTLRGEVVALTNRATLKLAQQTARFPLPQDLEGSRLLTSLPPARLL